MMTPMIIKYKAFLDNFNSNKMNKIQARIGITNYKNSKPPKMSNKESHKTCLLNWTKNKRTTKKTISSPSNNKATKRISYSKKATTPFLTSKKKKPSTSKSSNNSNKNTYFFLLTQLRKQNKLYESLTDQFTEMFIA